MPRKPTKPAPKKVKPVKAWALKRWDTNYSLSFSNQIYGIYLKKVWLAETPVTIVPGHIGKDFKTILITPAPTARKKGKP